MTSRFRWEWRDDVVRSDLRSTVKLVALVLVAYMDPDGSKAFPSVTTLAKQTSLSRRAVQVALRELVERSWLEKTREGKGSRSSEYAARKPHTTVSAQDVRSSASANVATPRGARGAHRGAGDSQYRAPGAPDLVLPVLHSRPSGDGRSPSLRGATAAAKSNSAGKENTGACEDCAAAPVALERYGTFLLCARCMERHSRKAPPALGEHGYQERMLDALAQELITELELGQALRAHAFVAHVDEEMAS